jgi:acyl-coenzyme A synthetase/AMP-(fatty) acid ligase/acyl carrier protein
VDSIWETFGALLAGIPTVLISEEVVRNPADLVATLGRHRVTRIVLVPSLLRAMLEAEPNIRQRLTRLKYWISSGEALSADLVSRFRDSFPDAVLLNLYGSSEVSADVTCFDMRHMQAGDPVLIGRPIANTQIYILDRNLQPVSIGVPGQLCVSGHGLARGYLGRAKETAEKFVSNPFRPECRLYLTGDRARFRRDGNIEYLGRIDHQVKIRGFRVELGEIESSLREHPSVKQAVVTARGDSNGDRHLVAYFVQNPPSADERELPATADQPWAKCTSGAVVPQLRRFLQERLPDYMLPAEFVVLRSFPLTPSGKIDRRAIPRMEAVAEKEGVADAPPTDEIEQAIAEMWQKLLGIKPPGVYDNFFELGGDSLLGTRLLSWLRSSFRVQLPLQSLLEVPTVAGIAQRIRALQ